MTKKTLQTSNTFRRRGLSKVRHPDVYSLSSKETHQIYGGADGGNHHSTAEPASVATVEASPLAGYQPSGLPTVGSSDLIATGWSESIQSVLEQPPAALPRYLLMMGMAFTGFFGIWAWTGSLQEVSQGQGELIPQGETYKIQPVIAGEVETILVKEGDRVRQGQLLFELESTLPKSEVTRLEKTLAAAQQRLIQVRSLIESSQREQASQQAIAEASLQAQVATIAQSQASTETHQAMLSSLQNELAVQQERLARIGSLESQGAISQEYLFNIEQGIRSQENSITQTQGELNKNLAQTHQLEAERVQKQAEAQQSLLLAQQSLQKLWMEADELEATIADTQTLIEQAQTRQQQREVRSPSAGILSSLEIDNIGEFIQPGQPLAEVVPASTPLVLSARIPHAKAGLIKAGMSTQVKFEAFPYQTYGVQTGTVLSISPDAKGNRETGTGYQVEIALEKDHIMHENQPIALQVGQTASAEIVVRQRKIIDLILDPIRRLQASDLNL